MGILLSKLAAAVSGHRKKNLKSPPNRKFGEFSEGELAGGFRFHMVPSRLICLTFPDEGSTITPKIWVENRATLDEWIYEMPP